MILCDVNVWLALAIFEHPHHQRCVDWFDRVVTPDTIHFCRVTQQGLLRLLTAPQILVPIGLDPLTNTAAWGAYEQFSDDDRVGLLLAEPAGTEELWRELSTQASASPKLWTDSYLAAFAMAAGATFVTIDKAFRQFTDLDLVLIE